MNLLITQLIERKKYLENLLSDIANQLIGAPQGKLRVRNDNGVPRYYHVTTAKDTRGRYIRKKEQELACRLAQKDYMLKLQQEAQEELADIDKYLMCHGRKNIESVYNDLNNYRKSMITPMVLSDEQYVKQWESESYETNPYMPEEKVYPTKKDELVRSKSEVLLADMYCEMGIPYRYEAQLKLKGGRKKYPDFTLLKLKTREVIYHEHLGLLDKEEYRKINLAKIEMYRKNGIYLGKNLILTYEAEGYYLNIKEIKQMVEAVLL